MTRHLYIHALLVIALLFAVPACEASASDNAAPAADGTANTSAEAHQEVTLHVEGMSCISCVMKLEKTLRETEGVVAATVALRQKSATITFDASLLDLDGLIAIVEDAGYSAAAQ